MAKKVFTDESLSAFVSEVKSYIDTNTSTKEHTHSWNDLKNKPFGEEITEILHAEQFTCDSQEPIDLGAVRFYMDNTYIVYFDDARYECMPWSQTSDWIVVGNLSAYDESQPDNGMPFYILDFDDGTFFYSLTDGTHTVSIYKAEYVTSPLDEKYIPDTIARIDDVPSVTTATVGQTIVVKAVDENGKPTEWEAIDMQDIESILNTKLNRSSAANTPDVNYTTYMVRGTSLNHSETNPTVNGTIAWTYE